MKSQFRVAPISLDDQIDEIVQQLRNFCMNFLICVILMNLLTSYSILSSPGLDKEIDSAPSLFFTPSPANACYCNPATKKAKDDLRTAPSFL